MPVSQLDKALRFQALHERPGPFVVANPWDAGSARALAGLGFEALATSSGASAAALGKLDGQLTRDEVLAHVRAVVGACDLPVAADLENGFGDDEATVAETVRLAAEAGAVGGSIEDFTGRDASPFYELDHAVRRVSAAVQAARALPFPFMLTARCENFLRGRPDLDDTIARLQAYEAAGAQVLFAPALPSLEAVRAVCSALKKPVNFMASIPGRSFSVGELQAAGVKRISLAGSLHRAAMKAVRDAAHEVLEHGSFGYLDRK